MVQSLFCIAGLIKIWRIICLFLKIIFLLPAVSLMGFIKQGNIMKYHVNSEGPSQEGFLKGFESAIKIAINNGTNEVALAVHGKTNLSGTIENALDELFVKQLKKDGFVNNGGVTVFLLTEKIQSDFQEGVILACHSSGKFLKKLISDCRATDIVYVPWHPDEVNRYLGENDSTEITL